MSPSITKAEQAMLGRRELQPVKAEGELLAIFVAGALKNPLNAYDLWVKRVGPRYKREWKERVALALMEAGFRRYTMAPPSRHNPLAQEYAEQPKHVAFLANVHQQFDTDGLQAALKACRDGLVECSVIHSDAPDSGHVFTYEQRIDRARRGVEIRVSLASRGSAAVAAP